MLWKPSQALPREIESAPVRRSSAQAGVTMIELIVTLAVLGILSATAVPWLKCSFQKARYARVMSEMDTVRDRIEAYEAELGAWPPDLEAAMRGEPVPASLVYCTESGDANKGHGNETCFFLDSDNPSGNNNHGGFPGAGYLLRTEDYVSECANVRFAWTRCCGRSPEVVAWSDDTRLPGHPGNPQGGDNGSGGGNGGGNGSGNAGVGGNGGGSNGGGKGPRP